MTSQLDVAKGREIVARWCNLAETRLKYLSDLYDSGRWRRFHSEQEFLENIREAKTAVETWRDLLTREATSDNRPIDLSWLGRAKTPLPRDGFRRDSADLPQVADVPVAPQARSVVVEMKAIVNETLPADPPLSENAFAAVLDRAAIAARYPSLRHSL
jgi:uncharacterized repeat protein (TIGR03809 family)